MTDMARSSKTTMMRLRCSSDGVGKLQFQEHLEEQRGSTIIRETLTIHPFEQGR